MSASPTRSESTDYRYVAFISYRHAEADRRAAVWMHRALETYRVPPKLAVQFGLPARLGRVFRDEEELAASPDLSRDIEEALRRSTFLIVVCSRRTPGSEWVNREVERFCEMGRDDRILALLIEGEPAEAFPRALRQIRGAVAGGQLPRPVEEIEPLAADMRPVPYESGRGRRRTAFLRLAAPILGVRFDDLRQREAERRHRRLMQVTCFFSLIALTIGVLAVAAWVQRNEARSERDRADANAATAESRRQILLNAVTNMRLGTDSLIRRRDTLAKAESNYILIADMLRGAYEEGDRTDAEVRLQLALALSNLSYAELLAGPKRAPDAVRDAREAVEYAPERADIWVNLAHGYLFENKFSDAEQIYRANRGRRILDSAVGEDTVPGQVRADFQRFRDWKLTSPGVETEMRKVEDLLSRPQP